MHVKDLAQDGQDVAKGVLGAAKDGSAKEGGKVGVGEVGKLEGRTGGGGKNQPGEALSERKAIVLGQTKSM